MWAVPCLLWVGAGVCQWLVSTPVFTTGRVDALICYSAYCCSNGHPSCCANNRCAYEVSHHELPNRCLHLGPVCLCHKTVHMMACTPGTSPEQAGLPRPTAYHLTADLTAASAVGDTQHRRRHTRLQT